MNSIFANLFSSQTITPASFPTILLSLALALAAGLFPAALWATYLLGPVMAGRYLYPCICCLPVLASRAREE